jgi:hypothetical protein
LPKSDPVMIPNIPQREIYTATWWRLMLRNTEWKWRQACRHGHSIFDALPLPYVSAAQISHNNGWETISKAFLVRNGVTVSRTAQGGMSLTLGLEISNHRYRAHERDCTCKGQWQKCGLRSWGLRGSLK